MAEHDPHAFEQLFEAEPTFPSASEVAEWLRLYTGLTELLERQLDETRQFAERAPDAMRRYLDGENIKILTEELGAFQARLAIWGERGRT